MRGESSSEFTSSILEMTGIGFSIANRNENTVISIFANSEIGETEGMLTQRVKRNEDRISPLQNPRVDWQK